MVPRSAHHYLALRTGTPQPSLANRNAECDLVAHINRSECRSAPNRTDPYRTVHRSVVKTAPIHRSVQIKEQYNINYCFFTDRCSRPHFLQWIGGRIGALFCGSVPCVQTPTTTPSRKEFARLMFAGGAPASLDNPAFFYTPSCLRCQD